MNNIFWTYIAKRYTTSCFLLVAFLCLSGCVAKNDAPPEDTNAKPAISTVERGPVRATVEVSPRRARLSDEPTLTLTINSAEGVNVRKPPFGETLGDFLIRDFHEPLPKVRDGREIIRQIYTLEPTRAGRMTIDPISISFTDLRPDGDGKTHTLETEPISVEITSRIGDQPPSLGEMRGAAGPVGLTATTPFWVWALIGASVAALIVGLWLRRRRRRETAAAVVVLSPEEMANLELDQLVKSGLAERDVKLFYVELTAIVRRYIERTTGVRAPEQTTEEFLREISRGGSLSHWERARVRASVDDDSPSPPVPLPEGEGWLRENLTRLRNFLEAADLVKFAAHRPRSEDIDESVRRARLFIGMRRPRQVAAPEPEEVAV